MTVLQYVNWCLERDPSVVSEHTMVTRITKFSTMSYADHIIVTKMKRWMTSDCCVELFWYYSELFTMRYNYWFRIIITSNQELKSNMWTIDADGRICSKGREGRHKRHLTTSISVPSLSLNRLLLSLWEAAERSVRLSSQSRTPGGCHCHVPETEFCIWHLGTPFELTRLSNKAVEPFAAADINKCPVTWPCRRWIDQGWRDPVSTFGTRELPELVSCPCVDTQTFSTTTSENDLHARKWTVWFVRRQVLVSLFRLWSQGTTRRADHTHFFESTALWKTRVYIDLACLFSLSKFTFMLFIQRCFPLYKS